MIRLGLEMELELGLGIERRIERESYKVTLLNPINDINCSDFVVSMMLMTVIVLLRAR
jgi:hypothetical protein